MNPLEALVCNNIRLSLYNNKPPNTLCIRWTYWTFHRSFGSGWCLRRHLLRLSTDSFHFWDKKGKEIWWKLELNQVYSWLNWL